MGPSNAMLSRSVAGPSPSWARTTETINPHNVAKEAPGFDDLLITQCHARGLVPPQKVVAAVDVAAVVYARM